MCGIHGIYRFDGLSVEPGALSAMGDRTRHRGPDDEGSHIKETSPNIQPPPLDPLLYPVGASNQETSQNQSQFQPAPKPAPAFAPATGSGAPLPGGTQVPQLAPARVKTNKAPSPAPDVTPHNDSLLDL